MAIERDQIAAEALKLEPEDRVALADKLLASVYSDAEIEAAWSEEVNRRVAEIDAGRMGLVPAAEAIARARNTLR